MTKSLDHMDFLSCNHFLAHSNGKRDFACQPGCAACFRDKIANSEGPSTLDSHPFIIRHVTELKEGL